MHVAGAPRARRKRPTGLRGEEHSSSRAPSRIQGGQTKTEPPGVSLPDSARTGVPPSESGLAPAALDAAGPVLVDAAVPLSSADAPLLVPLLQGPTACGPRGPLFGRVGGSPEHGCAGCARGSLGTAAHWMMPWTPVGS